MMRRKIRNFKQLVYTKSAVADQIQFLPTSNSCDSPFTLTCSMCTLKVHFALASNYLSDSSEKGRKEVENITFWRVEIAIEYFLHSSRVPPSSSLVLFLFVTFCTPFFCHSIRCSLKLSTTFFLLEKSIIQSVCTVARYKRCFPVYP